MHDIRWDEISPKQFRQYMSHSLDWTIKGQCFAINVCYADQPIDAALDPPGSSASWQVCAVVYPSHPRFAAFMRGDINPSAPSFPPLRRDGRYICRQGFGLNGAVESYIVGVNYWRSDNGRFREIVPRDQDADELFADAMALYRWMDDATEHAPPWPYGDEE